MTNPQETELGTNPPQFNSLDAETTRVSLTIGGNDIGFSEIAAQCVTVNRSARRKDKYDSGGKDQIAERIAATRRKWRRCCRGSTAAPLGKVFVVNYAAIFRRRASLWPQIDGLRRRSLLRSKEKELNSMPPRRRQQRRTLVQLVQRQHRTTPARAPRPAGSSRSCRHTRRRRSHPTWPG